MPIYWSDPEGKTGIAENAYEFQMQHSEPQVAQRGHTSDIPELGPSETERIWTDYGKPEHPQTKYPYEDTSKEEINKRLKDVGEGIFRRGSPLIEDYLKNLPGDFDAYHLNKEFFEEGLSDEQKKASPQFLYIKRKPLTAENTPAGMHEQLAAFQKRLDSTPPAEANALQKFLGSLNIMPAPGKPQEEWTAKEHLGSILNQAMAGMGGGIRAPTRGFPEGWGTQALKTEGKAVLSAADYPHVQQYFKEAVEQGNTTVSDISNHIFEKHGLDLSPFMIKKLTKNAGIELEKHPYDVTNTIWNPDLVNKLKQGYETGKSFDHLATELSLSRGQVAGKVNRLMKEGVLSERETTYSGVESNPEKLSRFKELRAKGLSYKEIAKDLDITVEYARTIASRNK